MSPLLKRNSERSDSKTLFTYCCAAGLLAGLAMCIVFLIHDQTVLGGSTTLLRVDLYHQYGPLFAEYCDRVTEGQSLVYSWTSGLGSSFLGNLFNYLASPSAIVVFLLGHENMPESIALMLLIKTICSSALFTYYLNKSNKCINMMSVAFGILYAFSGYVVSYFWNIMWLDAVAAFPLVVLGIENIIRKGKPHLYILSLAFIMVTNYYMAYIVCLLSIFYFIYYFFGHYSITAYLTEKAVEKTNNLGNEGIPAVLEQEVAAELPDLALGTNANAVEADLTDEIQPEQATEQIAAEVEQTPPVMAVFEVEQEHAPEQPATAEQPAPDEQLSEREIRKLKNKKELARVRGFLSHPALIIAVSALITAFFSSSVIERNDDILVITLFCLIFFLGSALIMFVLSRVLFKFGKTMRLLRNNRFFASGVRFALASVFAAAMAAVVLLPVFYILQGSSATGSSFPSNFKTYFNVFDFIANHLASVEITWRSSADDNIILPNVYCGIITVFLVPLYLFTKTIPVKQKIASCIFLAFFAFCMSNNFAEFIWHGFHMPNDLPFRYSFGYCFLLLLIAYKTILRLNEISNKMLLTTGIALMAFIVITQKDGQKNIENFDVVLSLILVFTTALILWIIRSGNYKQNYAVYLLIGAIIVEVLVADTPNFVMAQSKDAYAAEYDDYQTISQEVEDEDTTPFYRTELTSLRTRMDASWYGYNGVSVFSSMAYESVAKLMERIGLYGNNINSYTYNPQTAVFNSMFSLKYLYDNADALNNTELYSYITSVYANSGDTDSKVYDAYQYNYWLPLGYVANGELEDWDVKLDSNNFNPFEIQNDYISLSTGIEDVLVDVAPDSIPRKSNVGTISDESVRSGNFTATVQSTSDTASVMVSFIMPEDGNFYTYFKNSSIDSFTISGGGFSRDQSYGGQAFVADAGYQKKGDTVTVEIKFKDNTSSANVYIYGAQLDSDKFEQAYNTFNSNGLLNITEFDETYIEGTVDVNAENALLYTSIPADDSWVVTIDGQTVSKDDTVTLGGALLAVKIPEGEHTVTFSYEARGLKTGAVCSVFAIILFAVYTALPLLLNKKRKGKISKSFFLPISNIDN